MDSGILSAVAKIVRGPSTVVAEDVCRICGLSPDVLDAGTAEIRMEQTVAVQRSEVCQYRF